MNYYDEKEKGKLDKATHHAIYTQTQLNLTTVAEPRVQGTLGILGPLVTREIGQKSLTISLRSQQDLSLSIHYVILLDLLNNSLEQH